jgi:hypothetical protein
MTEHTVELRRFEEADRETLASWFPPARSEGAFIDERWLEWMREDQGEPDAPLFLVGHQDGGPVSAVSYHPKGDDRAIVTIIVAPHARRERSSTPVKFDVRSCVPCPDVSETRSESACHCRRGTACPRARHCASGSPNWLRSERHLLATWPTPAL